MGSGQTRDPHPLPSAAALCSACAAVAAALEQSVSSRTCPGCKSLGERLLQLNISGSWCNLGLPLLLFLPALVVIAACCESALHASIGPSIGELRRLERQPSDFGQARQISLQRPARRPRQGEADQLGPVFLPGTLRAAQVAPRAAPAPLPAATPSDESMGVQEEQREEYSEAEGAWPPIHQQAAISYLLRCSACWRMVVCKAPLALLHALPAIMASCLLWPPTPPDGDPDCHINRCLVQLQQADEIVDLLCSFPD